MEFIHANHSIADAVSFATKSPVGTVIHTGDFKIDPTPITQGQDDGSRPAGVSWGKRRAALLADSTNVERPGYTRSERAVGASFDAIFKGCQERIIVTTFASNVTASSRSSTWPSATAARWPSPGAAWKTPSGWPRNWGYTEIPKGVLVDINQIKSQPKDKICIITTGSQGETMSALSRMAFSSHRQVDIQAG